MQEFPIIFKKDGEVIVKMDDKIQQFKQFIKCSNQIVFFGGAGVSTESGIPDFRSKDGLYHQKYDYPPRGNIKSYFLYEQYN